MRDVALLGVVLVACASTPAPRPEPARADTRCVAQEAIRSDRAVFSDGPRGWLISQARPEGDGTLELIDATTRVTLARAALGPVPSIVRAVPEPSGALLCALVTPFGGGRARMGAWDVARANWRWSAPAVESRVLIAGRDRCFFGDDQALVARALDDGRELSRVPIGVPGFDVVRVTRGGQRLLIESADRSESRVHALLDGETGALLTWFSARCATLAASGAVTVGWPAQSTPAEATARAHAERKLGATLVVTDSCALPSRDLLPLSPLDSRLPWPWLMIDERIVLHVPAGLFVWDWQRSAPRRISDIAPADPLDVNGRHHPLTPALAPDGAWVGVVGDTAKLARWTLAGDPLDALPLPSIPGKDDAASAAWQVFVGPRQGDGHPLAVMRDDARGRALYLGDSARPGVWRPTAARLYPELWPLILWPRATPGALLIAEPHFGPQVIDVQGRTLGRFAPKPTMSRVLPFIVAADRLLIAVQPVSDAQDDGVYVLGLPGLEVITRQPWVAPPSVTPSAPDVAAVLRADGTLALVGPTLPPAGLPWVTVAMTSEPADSMGRLVPHPMRDAYDLLDADGLRRATLGVVDGHGWVEGDDGAVRCDGPACARYRLVNGAPLSGERCVLAR